MADRVAELEALKSIMAAGRLSTSYDGQTVTYGSAADLSARIRFLEAEIARSSKAKRSMSTRASFRRV